jgi:hypothetical protein
MTPEPGKRRESRRRNGKLRLPDGYAVSHLPPTGEEDEPITAEQLRRIDPGQLRLTMRARRRMLQHRMLLDDDEQSLAAVAPLLAADLGASTIETTPRMHIVRGTAYTWKISPNGQALIDLYPLPADAD